MAQQQLVKISWKGELRLVPCGESFEDFVTQCASRFDVPAHALAISYQDSEGDSITISTDAELSFAFKSFEQNGLRPKFELVRKPAAPGGPVGAVRVGIAERMRQAAIARQAAMEMRQSVPAVPVTEASAVSETSSKKQQDKTDQKAELKKAKAEKKRCLKQQKKELQHKELKGTRLIRLRWRDPQPAEEGNNGKGCYLGVRWKNRVVNLDCGKGLKSLWMVRRLDNGDWILTSVVCPKRFLRMNNNGVVEFNNGQPGPMARWSLVDAETGATIEDNDVDVLLDGARKVKLGSKANPGQLVGKKITEIKKCKKAEPNPEAVKTKTLAHSDLEGLAFTVEKVDGLSTKQVVKLCRHGLNLVDPKLEDEKVEQQPSKKQPGSADQKAQQKPKATKPKEAIVKLSAQKQAVPAKHPKK